MFKEVVSAEDCEIFLAKKNGFPKLDLP